MCVCVRARACVDVNYVVFVNAKSLTLTLNSVTCVISFLFVPGVFDGIDTPSESGGECADSRQHPSTGRRPDRRTGRGREVTGGRAQSAVGGAENRSYGETDQVRRVLRVVGSYYNW